MRKLVILLIGITVISCNSQTKSEKKHQINIKKSTLQKESLKIKNDSIYFSIKSNADSLFLYTSTFGYEKVEKENEYFTKKYQQDSLDYSHFTYSISQFKNGIQSNAGNGIHRGKYFPKAPKHVKELKGDISTIPINSKYLKEERNIFIYKPIEFDKNKVYNLLFILDANKNTMKYHSSLIEHLVNTKKIKDLIIVGIPNREIKKNKKYSEEIDFRALEFLEGYSKLNHSAHHGHSEIPSELINRHTDFINFLEKEVYNYIISNFNITKDYYKKCIYGTSNGGDFVVSLSRKKPSLFGSNIAFSFGWDYNIKEPIWSDPKLPNFYLAVGKYEKGFVEVVKNWKSILERQGAQYKFSKELSGHDNAMWNLMFVKYIEEIFNK